MLTNLNLVREWLVLWGPIIGRRGERLHAG